MDTPTPVAALKAAAVDQAGDAIIVIDEDGMIRVWNRFAEQLFGWSAEQTLGQDVQMMIPERLRPGHNRGFSAAISSGKLASDGKARHTKAIHSSGNYVYVTMTFALILDDDGQATGSVAVAREWIRDKAAPAAQPSQA